MVKHLVFWRLHETAEGKSKDENAQKIKVLIESLKSVIPEIRSVEVGLNFTESAAAFDVALYSEFETKDALNVYQQHPEHVKVAGFIKNVTIERCVVDYEI
ncbi:Stress responsive alpha-beta barrel domain protein [Chloroherpeton thalassium ATCC 35110]|uniref:Stress responsive alpha-beta barrel domain protein n=1 Tax=Chloroherpeton thalassium (strain ATCC 35110 / GB-78) TaxID=517418 RepID=B3QZ80_CHLT3|nr:Dabb family protein [Chloroherpeton thalassium]ACF13773.1 Stress responsive alpha-beta barrel domain protein [Chloroherpeton thalassium ATCC 35110]